MNTIPFDLHYVPDFIFDTGFTKKAKTFPREVEIQGILALSPEVPVNLARLALIIDDYLVQISSSGNVYILNIPDNTYMKRNVCDFLNAPRGNEWFTQVALGAIIMLNAVGSNERVFKLFEAFEDLLCRQTHGIAGGYPSESLETIRNNIGLSNPDKLMIESGTWDFVKNHVTWGKIADMLFKKYYSDSFELY